MHANAGIIFFKTLRARTQAPLLSRTHGIAPTWNPHWVSWTPFWTRVVRCGFSTTSSPSYIFDSYGCSRAGVEDIVLGAEELRYAAQAVGKISGLVDAEDVLDVIFSQFCIGK